MESNPNKIRAFIEATYPAFITIWWVWAEPFGRSHYLSNAFIALNILFIAFIVYIEDSLTPGEIKRAMQINAFINSLKYVIPIICLGSILILSIGLIGNALTLKPRLLLSLLSYPIWALLQDGIVLLFILPRAERALGKNCGAIYACFLFSIIHLPSPIFSISSFILIATLIVVWRKYHSLIAVALIHGILGALANKTLLFSMRIGKAGLSL
jgi:hypothetical protein